MAYAIASDALLRSVLIVVCAMFALGAVLLVTIVVLHIMHALRRLREARVQKEWGVVFAECTLAVPTTLPAVRRSDGFSLLRLFNYYHHVLRGQPTQNLNAVARNIGVDVIAREMLARRSVRYRLLGVVTCGNMRDEASWGRLLPLLDDPVTSVSLFAARSLLQIRPMPAARFVVERAATRHDWHAAKLAIVLQESSPEYLTAPLVRAIERAGVDSLPSRYIARLLRLLEFADASIAADAVRKAFRAHGADTDIVIACLRALTRREDADIARGAAMDQRWAVRAAAVTSLGRIGNASDATFIARLTDDAHWWVRHRAAQALLERTECVDAVAPQTPRAQIAIAHERSRRLAA